MQTAPHSLGLFSDSRFLYFCGKIYEMYKSDSPLFKKLQPPQKPLEFELYFLVNCQLHQTV